MICFFAMLVGLGVGWFHELAGAWIIWLSFIIFVLLEWIFSGNPIRGIYFWFFPLAGLMFYVYHKLKE
jgi:hypothetical protein